MRKVSYITILFFMIISQSALAQITISGGTATTPKTPDDVIALSTSATKVGPNSIKLTDDLTVSDYYDDTGWTYTWANGKHFYTNSTTNWASGKKIEISGKVAYIEGARHNLNNPTSGTSEQLMNGGHFEWYDVYIDQTNEGSGDGRMQFSNADATSEIVMTLDFLGGHYFLNSIGNIALLEITLVDGPHRFGPGYGIPDKLTYIGRSTTPNLFTSDYGGNPGHTGNTTINGLAPIFDASIGGGFITFFHSEGGKTYFLNNPELPAYDRVAIYNSGEIIRVNTDLNIELSGPTTLSGIAVHAFSGSYNFNLTETSDAQGKMNPRLMDVWRGQGQTVTNYLPPTNITDRTSVDVAFYRYDLNLATIGLTNLGLNGAEDVLSVLATDSNISETTKATVDAYTEIDNLDKFYDRTKSWKMDSANVDYLGLDTLPISVSGSTLDLGSRNLTIDATAAAAFAINKNTHTITIKASTLKGGNKFTSITTTGTISTANGAAIEFGYTHSGGTQKYLELTGLASADVSVEDNVPATPVSLGSATNQTGTYKLLFTAPTDASNTVVEVTRTGYSTWTEQFPENDLSMTRAITQYQTTQLAERQIDMLNYAHRILQKEEAINATLNATTPTVTVTNTITSTSSPASEANQLAILNVLKRILTKITSNREALNR